MHSKLLKFSLTASLVALGTLVILPSTGWLIRQQLRIVGGHSIPSMEAKASGDWNSLNQKEQAAAAAHPADFELQLAWALRSQEISSGDSDNGDDQDGDQTKDSENLKGKRLLAVLPLRAEFNNCSELQADILRFLCSGDFKINRLEENILLPPKQQQESIENERKAVAENKQARTSRAAIALAEDAAKRGEALDPKNAFFPTMRAAAYLAERNDTKAFAALERAAGKREWNDYGADEARARVALLEAGTGSEPGGFARATTAAAILFPHFAQIRDEARVMTALAVQREIAGDREGGLQIRQSMGRVGAIMRAQPRTIICSLVGCAITGITDARPGGVPVLDLQAEKQETRTAIRESRYVAYLTQIGHPDEAAWFLAERSAAEKITAISRQTFEQSDNVMMPFIVLNAWWSVGLFCLVSILMVIGFGGMAAIAARAPRIRAALPLHRAVCCGLILFAQAPLGCIAAHCLVSDARFETSSLELYFAEAAVIGLALFFLKRKRTGHEFLRDAAIIIGTVAALCGIAAVAAWLGARIATPFGVLTELNGSAEPASETWADLMSRAILGAVAISIPAIAMFVLAIRSKLRRQAVSVGIVRGLRSIAVPTSTILLLIYALVCGGTLYEEGVVRNEVNHQIKDEGSYSASKLGVEWPGPVVPATSVKSGNSTR